MKKFICILTSVMLVFLLASCTKKEEIPLEVPRYTEEEMGIHKEDGYQGIYILNNDGTYMPLAKGYDGYTCQSNKTSLKRYIWFYDQENLNLIPSLSKDSRLVLVCNTEEAIPKNFYLEKYKFLGYTVGCHLYTSGDRIYLKSKKTLSGSYSYSSLKHIDDESEYEVITINEKYPVSNIDNNIEMLLGLEYGKYYKFQFYKGTKNMAVTLVADTLAFQSESVLTLESPYQRTSKGYFTVNLPNLSSGYYYIAGLGMFYYEGD